MVAELWKLKMGNQVSGNFKNSLFLESAKKSSSSYYGKQAHRERHVIGILSFEVANVMSKIIHLHKSLADSEISKLKNEILKSEGIRILVSDDETKLLEMALAEKLDDLNRVASLVSRLGKKCTIPALQGFEHVYGDIVSGVIDVKELGFLVKDMEGRVRKMERYVSSTANLYAEMEVLNELEIATKKFQQNQHEESRKAYEQKLVWQNQDVKHLKDVSLWNQTYDKVAELLARTVCTIYARISLVFGNAILRNHSMSNTVSVPSFEFRGSLHGLEHVQKSGEAKIDCRVQNGVQSIKPALSKSSRRHSGTQQVRDDLENSSISYRSQVVIHKSEAGLFGPEDFNFACGVGPGRLFMECLSLSSSASKVDDDDDDTVNYDRSSQISGCYSVASSMKGEQRNQLQFSNGSTHSVPFNGDLRLFKGSLTNGGGCDPRSILTVYAPLNTVGGSALALHYANVIIVIEKLLRYPHLVGDEARDDLYQMLPTSLRKSLKRSLKAYVKDLAIYDAPLAHDWKERLDQMLKWLAPLAHNMIRWQSERNFEQQQIVTRTNVLLLQTLYFADRSKTEAAICELLVGLNYICRYEHQQNALLDCASSFDLEDCMEWQLQMGASLYS